MVEVFEFLEKQRTSDEPSALPITNLKGNDFYF